MVLLLTKTGDVETNPDPTTTNKRVWICDICCPPSTIHRYLDLPSTQRILTHNAHRHNTIPPLKTLVQAPYSLPTHNQPPPTTATKTHVKPSPCSHRIGKAQTQSTLPLSPFPPTPPETNTYTSHILHQLLSSHAAHLIHPPHQPCRQPRSIMHSQHTHMQHKQ